MYATCAAVIHDSRGYADDYFDEFPDDDLTDDIAEVREHTAIVVDGSGYFAALKTKEDFGCVLFEDKEVSE